MSFEHIITVRTLRTPALSCLELLETFMAEAPESKPEPELGFRLEKSLTMENCDFTFPGGRHSALKNLNLTIKRGEKVGLIGASGAGKSTLALLMTGLVTPQNGRFWVDGHILSSAGQAAYVRRMGFVPQNPLLLQGTVADNAALCQWGEEYDRWDEKSLTEKTKE